jgi:polysaccharide biosynthesis protein PslH
MRLLVLTYRLPWHTYTADRYTMLHFVKHFSKRHRITLAAFAESEEEAARADVLKPYCERVEPILLPPLKSRLQGLAGLASSKPIAVSLYRSRAMAETIQRIVRENQVDLAYVYHLRMGQYLADIDAIPRCIALQPVQTLNLKRFRDHVVHPLWKLFYTIEHQRMCRYEPSIAAKFDRCLLISEKDRKALDPDQRLQNVFFNPHGLDPDYFAPDASIPKEPHSIIFHGSMRYQANEDAILYFSREIYPLVKQQVPDARLYVVGLEPPASVRALSSDPSITVTGFVPDTRDYLNRAQVAVDPLRIGAGLQNKVLESMSMGLPVVATCLANEGIGATCEEQIVLADDPSLFAERIVSLFLDEALRKRLGAAARTFIQRNWSWERYYEPLEELFEQLVDGHGT